MATPNDDFPAELGRAYERIEALEQTIKQLEREKKALHNKAWWRTYRAALTGLLSDVNGSLQGSHDAAERAADIAHGSIQ